MPGKERNKTLGLRYFYQRNHSQDRKVDAAKSDREGDARSGRAMDDDQYGYGYKKMLNRTFANNSKSDRALRVEYNDRPSVFDTAKA